MLLIVQIRFCFVISYWPQCQGRFSLSSSRLLQLLEGLCHHCIASLSSSSYSYISLSASSKTSQSCHHINLVITASSYITITIIASRMGMKTMFYFLKSFAVSFQVCLKFLKQLLHIRELLYKLTSILAIRPLEEINENDQGSQVLHL